MSNIIRTIPTPAKGLQAQRAAAWLATTLFQIGNPRSAIPLPPSIRDAVSNNRRSDKSTLPTAY